MDPSRQLLVEWLDAAETDELRRSFQAGELTWLAAPLGPVLYRELGARVDGGDVAGIRELLTERGVLSAPAGAATSDPTARTGGEDRPWWVAMLVLVAALALGAVALSRCDDDTSDGGDTVAARIADQPDLTTLAELLDRFGQARTLERVGPFTVFAPTDRAFAALPLDQFSALRAADASVVAAMLAAHTVDADLPRSDLSTGTLTTSDGRELDVEVDADAVRIGPAAVTLADLRATNGVVHTVDLVLVDPALLIPTRARPST